MSDHEDKLILSFDDFGISQKANEATLQLMDVLQVGRVSVMVNGILNKAEIQKLLESKVALDIHLDFKQGLTEKRKLKEGVLKRSALFILKYACGKYSPKKMELEWTSQMEKFKELFGKYPDGISSHQYIHFFPPYFEVAVGISEKYDSSYVRFGNNGLIGNKTGVFWILQFFRKIDRKLLRKSRLKSSDFLVSLDWIKDIEKFLHNLPAGTTEIVCHPERQEEFELMQKYF